MANSLIPFRSRSLEPYRFGSSLFSRLFDDLTREFDTLQERSGLLGLSVDVTESDKETRVTAELPGIRQEDIDLSVDGDVLTIRAEKRVERDDDGARHVRERTYGTFERMLRLRQPVDADQVRAHFDNGVLTVTLPRSTEQEDRRRIAIQSGPPPAATGSSHESRH